jgi:hypothetical protein
LIDVNWYEVSCHGKRNVSECQRTREGISSV